MHEAPSHSFASLPRETLTSQERQAMFELLSTHFEGVTPTQFEQDLEGKSWVILVRRGDRIVGFSTLVTYESMFEDQPVSVVYSGDTIVAPEAWGSPWLAKAWITTVNRLRDRYPRGKYYWLLLSSGFRTYRFLPVFWKEFYPCPNTQAPDHIRRLRDHLARGQFADQYDAGSGIVRFRHPQRLRGSLGEVASSRKADPYVEFFLRENPGHREGDELVCLTELSPANLTAAGRRMSAPSSR